MKAWLKYIFLISIALVICSCSKKGNSEVYLKVGSNLWPGYEPYYLAEHKGFYRDKHIRLVRLSSATQVARAYRNGQIDAACLTLNEVMSLREFINDFEIVVINDTSNGGDALVARPEIKSPKNLEGKKIGVESSALGAYVFNRVVQIHKLDHTKIEIVPLEVHEHLLAYKNKEVDAVITFEPVMTQLASLGAKVIFDSTQIPGEITDVTIVRKSFAAQHPALIKTLLNGWFSGLQKIQENDLDTKTFLMEKLSLSEEELLKSYQGLELPGITKNLDYLDKSKFAKQAEAIQKIMLDGKFLKNSIDCSNLANPSYIESLND